MTTPAGFVFAVKANRYITHMKNLLEPEEPVGADDGAGRDLHAQGLPVQRASACACLSIPASYTASKRWVVSGIA